MAKKKLLLFTIALPIFLVAMFSLGLYIKAKGFGTVAGPSILPPTALNTDSAKTGPSVLLVKESGVVTYKLPDSSDLLTMAQDEVNIPTGTTVKTGADTLAHVVFPDNSLMSLSKDTEVVINFEEKKIKIFQILGNTWHRVEKVLQGSSYEVETPNTLATVRGTEFNVGILNGETELYVMESTVEATKIVKENGETVKKEMKKVTKDQHVLVSAPESTSPIKLVALPEKKKNTDWFRRNQKLTEKIKEAEIEVEKKEHEKNDDEPNVTTTPDNLDLIKQNVRKRLMEGIKTDPDLEEIDSKFKLEKPTVTPASTPTPTPRKSNQSDSSVTPVLGASTSTVTEEATKAPTRTPTLAPTDTPISPIPTPIPVYVVTITELSKTANLDGLIKTLTITTRNPADARKLLSNLPQVVLKTENEKEAVTTQRSLEADGAIVELKTIN